MRQRYGTAIRPFTRILFSFHSSTTHCGRIAVLGALHPNALKNARWGPRRSAPKPATRPSQGQDIKGQALGWVGFRLFCALLLLSGSFVAADQSGASTPVALSADQARYARDAKQSLDEVYTKKIREYTTEPFFTSSLVDYLPASKTVPTPMAVLGDVAGAPGKLPYAADVHRYMRMLEQASRRAKVFSIGTSEEGREMIAIAIGSDANLAAFEENRARLTRLADPRTIKLDDAEAERLVAASVPIYYITGTIHSPETGAPTALMELAYRLIVDDSPYIQAIRSNVITLITPVVEVDGRDRAVDIYNWHLAHPNENWPPLVYWGKYVAHDNNRDAMGLTLKLTQNVLNSFLGFKAQVIHDLHESVPYLYDNTVGDGPYNAWIDPILADEWQMLGWNNMSELTKFGMPGVFTHGTFDTWSPGYLMFLAASHNGISRLYETFGNAGADTVERTLTPQQYSRTWYRQNPPLPKAKWSQRNNNNYQQTGLLTALSYFGSNNRLFLRNFYLKSKRSILKAKSEGPAAYVLPADDPRLALQAELLRVLQKQGCEISRATTAFSVTLPRPRRAPAPPTNDGSADRAAGGANPDGAQTATQNPNDKGKKDGPETRQFPAGSYIIRMDQPYSRIADMLLDYQYWSPTDPQRSPYDDTGWTFGELFNTQVVRVPDVKVLDVPMERVSGDVRAPGGLSGSGAVFAVNHNADPALMALRFRLKDDAFDVAEEAFEAAGQKFARGSFLIRNVAPAEMERVATELGVKAIALPTPPAVKSHPAKAARIALVHSWLRTQDEGWWRMAFDRLGVPYTYLSTQDLAQPGNLRGRFDVMVFPPVGRSPQATVAGMPAWGNPLPWKTTALTPNIGKEDSTDDMRPGLGWTGVANLHTFVKEGGLLIGSMDTAELAVTFGLTHGVSIGRPNRLKVTGAVLKSRFVDPASPIAYGYSDTLSIYGFDAPIFNISSLADGRGPRRGPEDNERVTGRGTPFDPDQPQGRPGVEIPEEPKAEAWQAMPITDEQRRNGINVIPTALRPRVVLRYADNRELLVSGLVDGGSEIAQHAAVVDVPVDKGHVVLFSNNPVWRGETQGSYFLVFNAILNFDQLGVARKLDEK